MKYITLVFQLCTYTIYSQSILDNSLKGLTSFNVGITGSEDLEKQGISESQIINYIELKLRMAGITVKDSDNLFLIFTIVENE